MHLPWAGFSRWFQAFDQSQACRSHLFFGDDNLTTFRETVAVNSNDLIVHTSYPRSSVVKLLQLLPATMQLQHWGDTDPWGYDILRVLREKTGRPIQPWRMSYRPMAGVPLSKRESAMLSRLIADPNLSDIRMELTAMQTEGSKGEFEQESLPIIDSHPPG